MADSAMLNSTINITTEGAKVNLYQSIAEGILFLIVIFVIVLDLLVITALTATSEVACSIRWILANLLVAGVVGALGSTLRHVIVVGEVFTPAGFELHSLVICRLYLVIIGIGNSGRIVMATFYAVTVFIVVRWWNRPVLAPRNIKYFIIGSAIAWVFVFPLILPFVLEAAPTLFCSTSNSLDEMEAINEIIVTVVFILLSTFPILFTLLILILTVCYIKWHTIRENKVAEKALIKFGFFVTAGQGINAVGQIICPTLFLVLLSQGDRSAIITTLMAIFDLSLFTVPIFIVIFFKPVWHKLRKWFEVCSCSDKCCFRTTSATQDTTQPHNEVHWD